MARVDQRVNQVIAHFGADLQKAGLRDMAQLRRAIAFAVDLGKVDGQVACAEAMGAAFRDLPELPTILKPQAG